jgi:PAS domain-containing protein
MDTRAEANIQLEKTLETLQRKVGEIRDNDKYSPEEVTALTQLLSNINEHAEVPIMLKKPEIKETVQAMLNHMEQLGRLDFTKPIKSGKEEFEIIQQMTEGLEELREMLGFHLEGLKDYKLMFEATRELVLIVNKTKTLVIDDANPILTKIFGFKKEDIVGLSLNDLLIRAIPKNTLNELITGELETLDTSVKDMSSTYHQCELWIETLAEGDKYLIFIKVKSKIEDINKKSIGTSENRKLWDRIQRRLEYFSPNLTGWLSSEYFPLNAHLPMDHIEVMKIYLDYNGDLNRVNRLISRPFNEIIAIVNDVSEKLAENPLLFADWKRNHQQHNLTFQDIQFISKNSCTKTIDLIIQSGNEITKNAFIDFILQNKIENTGLSVQLKKKLAELECETIQGILTKSHNKPKFWLKQKRVGESLINELMDYLHSTVL